MLLSSVKGKKEGCYTRGLRELRVPQDNSACHNHSKLSRSSNKAIGEAALFWKIPSRTSIAEEETSTLASNLQWCLDFLTLGTNTAGDLKWKP